MIEGILLVDKPVGKTAFDLIRALRKKLGIKKIGHAGTLDPFASGVMVLLIGRSYTRLSNTFLNTDKAYQARIALGAATDTQDHTGSVIEQSELVPSYEAVQEAFEAFQGTIEQTPPMYSAKKIQGKKLYELARRGIEVARDPVEVTVSTSLISYSYPTLDILVTCSKGTYVRTLADDIGKKLGCFGHLHSLTRIQSGHFTLQECIDGSKLFTEGFDCTPFIQTNERHCAALPTTDLLSH